MVVNASIPALVALRGLPLDRSRRPVRSHAGPPRLRGPGVSVTRVSRPWRRHGRRFVQVRLEVDDVRRLSAVAAFRWSDYALDERDGVHVYRQIVKAPVRRDVGEVGWTGSELIGFRLHLPSRIVYHNAPSKQVERGNILSWEQPMRDRLAGTPIAMEVRMEGESILYRTLAVFGAAAAAALALLAAAIWWVWRRGRAAQQVTGAGPRPLLEPLLHPEPALLHPVLDPARSVFAFSCCSGVSTLQTSLCDLRSQDRAVRLHLRERRAGLADGCFVNGVRGDGLTHRRVSPPHPLADGLQFVTALLEDRTHVFALRVGEIQLSQPEPEPSHRPSAERMSLRPEPPRLRGGVLRRGRCRDRESRHEHRDGCAAEPPAP